MIFIIAILAISVLYARSNNGSSSSSNNDCHGIFCEGNNGNHYGQQKLKKEDFKDQNSTGIENLKLENITITAEDVTDAKVYHKDKTYQIGSFCTYINPKDFSKTENQGRNSAQKSLKKPNLDLVITNNEGGFVMKRQGAFGRSQSVDYHLRINRQKVRYNTRFQFHPTGSNSYNCIRPEYIYLTIPAAQLAKAKAGIYDVSLNIALSYY